MVFVKKDKWKYQGWWDAPTSANGKWRFFCSYSSPFLNISFLVMIISISHKKIPKSLFTCWLGFLSLGVCLQEIDSLTNYYVLSRFLEEDRKEMIEMRRQHQVLHYNLMKPDSNKSTGNFECGRRAQWIYEYYVRHLAPKVRSYKRWFWARQQKVILLEIYLPSHYVNMYMLGISRHVRCSFQSNRREE